MHAYMHQVWLVLACITAFPCVSDAFYQHPHAPNLPQAARPRLCALRDGVKIGRYAPNVALGLQMATTSVSRYVLWALASCDQGVVCYGLASCDQGVVRTLMYTHTYIHTIHTYIMSMTQTSGIDPTRSKALWGRGCWHQAGGPRGQPTENKRRSVHRSSSPSYMGHIDKLQPIEPVYTEHCRVGCTAAGHLCVCVCVCVLCTHETWKFCAECKNHARCITYVRLGEYLMDDASRIYIERYSCINTYMYVYMHMCIHALLYRLNLALPCILQTHTCIYTFM